MKKVQNISKVTQAVIGIGVVEPSGKLSVPNNFENPNFKIVKPVIKKSTKKE